MATQEAWHFIREATASARPRWLFDQSLCSSLTVACYDYSYRASYLSSLSCSSLSSWFYFYSILSFCSSNSLMLDCIFLCSLSHAFCFSWRSFLASASSSLCFYSSDSCSLSSLVSSFWLVFKFDRLCIRDWFVFCMFSFFWRN